MRYLISIIKLLSYVSGAPAIWIGRHIRGLLWYYVWASFLCDIAALAMEQMGYVAKAAANVFYPLELLLVGLYFSNELFTGWQRKLFICIILCLDIWCIVQAADNWRDRVNWENVAIGLILFVMFCMVALYRVIRNVEHLKIEHSPLFIFAASFLLYASYSLVFMLFADYFRAAPKAMREQLWSIHNLLNVVKNLAIARMFFLQQRERSK
jgi:hypothetical protein